MAASQPTVAVTFGFEFARYVISEDPDANGDRIIGPMVTFNDAIDRFTGGDGLAEGLTVRVEGREPELESHLRDGDTLVICTAASAKGGYDGASA